MRNFPSRRSDRLVGTARFLAISAAILYSNWDRLPDRFPVHWGIHGPDRWVATTPANVAGMFATGAGICILMIITASMASRARISRSARSGDVYPPRGGVRGCSGLRVDAALDPVSRST